MNAEKRRQLHEKRKGKKPKREQRTRKKLRELDAAKKPTRIQAELKAAKDATSAKVVKKLSGNDALFERWKNGEQLFALAAESGFKRSKLRRIFQQLAGGKESFRALRNSGAGGSVEPFGGKRAGPRTAEVRAQDDSKVPTIGQALKADGWTFEVDHRGAVSRMVHIDPTGAQYVQAGMAEKADLIFRSLKFPDLPPMRLRRVETSRLVAQTEKKLKEIEHGEIALERTRERKRKAKQSRTKSDATPRRKKKRTLKRRK